MSCSFKDFLVNVKTFVTLADLLTFPEETLKGNIQGIFPKNLYCKPFFFVVEIDSPACRLLFLPWSHFQKFAGAM